MRHIARAEHQQQKPLHTHTLHQEPYSSAGVARSIADREQSGRRAKQIKTDSQGEKLTQNALRAAAAAAAAFLIFARKRERKERTCAEQEVYITARDWADRRGRLGIYIGPDAFTQFRCSHISGPALRARGFFLLRFVLAGAGSYYVRARADAAGTPDMVYIDVQHIFI